MVRYRRLLLLRRGGQIFAHPSHLQFFLLVFPLFLFATKPLLGQCVCLCEQFVSRSASADCCWLAGRERCCPPELVEGTGVSLPGCRRTPNGGTNEMARRAGGLSDCFKIRLSNPQLSCVGANRISARGTNTLAEAPLFSRRRSSRLDLAPLGNSPVRGLLKGKRKLFACISAVSWNDHSSTVVRTGVGNQG